MRNALARQFRPKQFHRQALFHRRQRQFRAVSCGDGAHQRQAQAVAFDTAILVTGRAGKTLERIVAQLGRQAGTRVGKGQAMMLGGLAEGQREGVAGRAVFDGVVDQIRQHLRDQIAIAQDVKIRRGMQRADQAAVFGQGFVKLPDFLRDSGEIDGDKAAAGTLTDGDVANVNALLTPRQNRNLAAPPRIMR